MISAQGLTKIYRSGKRALDGIDLEVKEGEIFGFLGPNGAGKTTAIKVLTTLTAPSSGTARVAGFDLTREAALVRTAIGYVAQEAGVDWQLTGRENLILQGRLYRLPGGRIRTRADELLDLFRLTSVADRPVMTYSGGMRRKLDIASGLIHRPRLLFLDEPTLGLDIESRVALWDYIRRLNSEGMTIFLTTHYLEEADRLAHRVAILDQGQVRAVDAPERLKDAITGDAICLTFDPTGPAPQPARWETLRSESYLRDLILRGHEVVLYVDNAQAVLPRVMARVDAMGTPPRSVTISRPTLDDVFLKLAGRHLHAAAEETPAQGWWAKWQNQKGGNGKGGAWPSSVKGDENGQAPEESRSKESPSASTPGVEAKASNTEEPWRKWQGKK